MSTSHCICLPHTYCSSLAAICVVGLGTETARVVTLEEHVAYAGHLREMSEQLVGQHRDVGDCAQLVVERDGDRGE